MGLRAAVRRRRRAVRSITPALAAALTVAGLGIAATGAPASATLTGSLFEGGDGNLVVDTAGNLDWANVSTATVLNKGVDNASGSSDNAFGKGSKEDDPSVNVQDGSIPPNKNDLTRFYEASQMGSNTHIYLYLGWERLVNIGNANLDFEINQATTSGFTGTTTGPVAINRTAGDLLVTYDFSGSGTPTLGLNTWLTSENGDASACYSSHSLPCWGNHIDLNSTDSEGAVNGGTVSDPLQSPAATLTTGLFGEAAIDLTNTGVFESNVCKAFGSTFVKSRSSSSFTAELKDFIAPVPVAISNCSTITIHKVTENGDDSFGYSTTGGLDPSTFSLKNGEQQVYEDLLPGSYSVTESLTTDQTTAGWTLKSLSCTTGGVGTTVDKSGPTASITLGQGGTVDCTYTNHINLSPTIATTLSKTTANINDSITDSATLSGATSGAGGTVTYHAYAGANTCTGDDLLNSEVTVTNGVVPDSTAFIPSAAGDYSFQAVYSGDADNNPATSDCSTEQLLVKTNPGIGTTLSADEVDVGSTVSDSAELTGATSDAGGTVTYTVYTNATCTEGARTGGTVDVSDGVVPDSNSLTFDTAGTYYWQASYSGDAKNNGATSDCTSETLVVDKLQPGASTAQRLIPNDSFMLSGATSNAHGTITFNLYGPADATCAGTPALTETVNVSGNGTYSTHNETVVADTEGTWRWESAYSGDDNNLPVSSSCGTEQFSITNG